jgi:glycosyltransferase involved in cell wall biosynthesis
MRASPTHLVLIPSYNTGPALRQTVQAAMAAWSPVWVVIDGSTDDSAAMLEPFRNQGLRVLPLPRNGGKGAAVLHGLRAATSEGFTHALVMDADGQHPADLIPTFMTISAEHPNAMVLGKPVFDRTAPIVRVLWRRVSNALVHFETWGCRIGDSLFGFRVYPILPLRAIMESTQWMRGFDFDAEAAVRLHWRGIAPINIEAPVRYFSPAEGGVSHFRYGRHNLLLAWMHLRLLAAFLWRNLTR